MLMGLEFNPLVRRRAYIAFKSGDLNERNFNCTTGAIKPFKRSLSTLHFSLFTYQSRGFGSVTFRRNEQLENTGIVRTDEGKKKWPVIRPFFLNIFQC